MTVDLSRLKGEAPPTRARIHASKLAQENSPWDSTVMVGEQDKRQEERIRAKLPVYLDSASGTTIDVSASGMFFETSASLAEGDLIDFFVEFDTQVGKRVLKCRGNIVRTELRDGQLGVAVTIQESAMEIGSMQRTSEAVMR